ncbi:hypothetical protein G6F43_011452 [Rhizopus delemar]|nr:hypothetical protein G6F43_011452 [Rhizopus delemar]
MSEIGVPFEYIHYFNVAEEIPAFELMEVENQQGDLYNIATIEWSHWELPDATNKVPESDIKKRMGLDGYQVYRESFVKTEHDEMVEASSQNVGLSVAKQPNKPRLSAKRAGFIFGVVERTARQCVKQYKDNEDKRLPGTKKQRTKWISKLQPHHTNFLCDFYDNNTTAVLWQTRDLLLGSFPEIGSITLSGLHKHLTDHACVTLKKLDKFISARNPPDTINKRRDKVIEWQSDENMK